MPSRTLALQRVFDRFATRFLLPLVGGGDVEIGDPVADVVDARSPTREKLRDRPVGIPRSQQLHFGLPEGQRDDGGTVGHLGLVGLETEHITIEGERRLDVRDGDPDMSDAGGSRHAVPPNENE